MQKQEKLNKAYELGFKYEVEYGGCCQSTIAAIQDALELRSEDVFKSGTGIAGGIGLVWKGLCGSLIGGAMMISYKFGRERSNFADPQKTRFVTYRLTEQLYDRFVKEYGSAYCYDIQDKIFGGVAYNLRTEKGLKLFLEDGGHRDKCPYVVGKGAQWAVEIILDEEEKREKNKPTKQ
jgi:C_GCAxxG_C_C family probable redox protein